jgi:hypothetical protein
MFDDLAALFIEQVMGAYEAHVEVRDGDSSGNSRHLRAALNAASALYHFREHLPQEHALTRGEVVRACPSYRLIADVNNAHKHRDLTRVTSDGPPLVTQADQISELWVVTMFTDEQGEYSDSRVITSVSCSDGSEMNLDEHLAEVANFWGTYLSEIGIIGRFPKQVVPAYPGRFFVPRADARSYSFHARNDVRLRHTIKIQSWNKSLGRAEPIDLSDKEISYRIYKPKYTFDVICKIPDGSDPVIISIDLEDEESARFSRIKTDTEKNAFMQEIARVYQDYILEQLRLALAKRESTSESGPESAELL